MLIRNQHNTFADGLFMITVTQSVVKHNWSGLIVSFKEGRPEQRYQFVSTKSYWETLKSRFKNQHGFLKRLEVCSNAGHVYKASCD